MENQQKKKSNDLSHVMISKILSFFQAKQSGIRVETNDTLGF